MNAAYFFALTVALTIVGVIWLAYREFREGKEEVEGKDDE